LLFAIELDETNHEKEVMAEKKKSPRKGSNKWLLPNEKRLLAMEKTQVFM